MNESRISLPIGEIDERIVNLRNKATRLTEEAAKLENEAAKLEALKKLAMEIGQPLNGVAAISRIAFGKPGEWTADMAEKILKKQGKPLRIEEIIPLLKKEGWKGSGDERKDY